MALIEGTNSYGSRLGADNYFNDSLKKETWEALSTGKRDQGLVEATRIFERQPLLGEKEVPSQDLHFPATGLVDNQGNEITATESLVLAQEAQYEYALILINDLSQINEKDATGTNIKKVKAGSAEVTYFKSKSGTRFPVVVQDLISSFIGGGSVSPPFVSGADQCSSFSDPTRNDLAGGLY